MAAFKRLIFLGTVLSAFPAAAQTRAPATPADPFKLRIGEANAFTRLKPGAVYQQTLAPFVQAAIQACLPPGAAVAAGEAGFILVADVRPDGGVTLEDVRPATPLSTCFAKAFGRETLRKPPVPPGGNFVYPIVVQLNVTS